MTEKTTDLIISKLLDAANIEGYEIVMDEYKKLLMSLIT